MIHLAFVSRSSDARRRAGRLRVAQPIRPSRKNELHYLDRLRPIVRKARAVGTAVGRAMKAGWDPPAGKARDGAPNLSDVMRRARAAAEVPDRKASAIVTDIVRRNRDEVDERLTAEIGEAVGIDISGALADEPNILQAMAEATEANIALIKSIPEEYLDKVEEAVKDAWTEGNRWEDLIDRIAEIGDITDDRAAFIARDQTSKLNASFNEARQTSVGIEEYEWSGSLDERERPSHREMEGTRHRWDDPPDVDGEAVHPGEAVNCRCVARPVFRDEDVEEQVDQDEEQEAA